MALAGSNRQLIPIPLVSGIGAGDEKQTSAEPTAIENMKLSQAGTWEKRPGSRAQVNSAIATPSTSGLTPSMAPFDDSTMTVFQSPNTVTRTNGISSHSNVSAKFINFDESLYTVPLPTIAAENRQMVGNQIDGYEFSSSDVGACAYASFQNTQSATGNITVVSYNKTLRTVISSTTISALRNTLDSQVFFRFVFISPTLYLYYIDNSTSEIRYLTISSAGVIGSPTALTGTALGTATANVPSLDAVYVSDSGTDYTVLAFSSSSAGGRVRIARLSGGTNCTGFQDWATGPTLAAGATGPIQVHEYGSNALVLSSRTGAYLVTYFTGTNAISATGTMSVIDNAINFSAFRPSGNPWQIFYTAPDNSVASFTSPIIKRSTYDGTTTSSSAVWTNQAILRTKGALYINRGLITIGTQSRFISSTLDPDSISVTMLVETDGSKTIAAKALPGRANNSYGFGTWDAQQVSQVQTSSSSFSFFLDQATSGVYRTAISVVPTIIRFSEVRTGKVVSDGLVQYIPNSVGMIFDGQNVFEQGFVKQPGNTEAVLSAGTIPVGTYQYSMVYEHIDTQGILHRSSPSIPVSATISAGTSNILFRGPVLGITSRSGVSVALYRTTAGGSTFYRIPDSSFSITGVTNYFSFNDSTSDTTLSTQAVLYTSGGVIEDLQPQPHSVSAFWDTRYLHAASELPYRIYYSKKKTDKYTAIGHTDSLFFELPGTSDPITAMCPLGDKLIIFTENDIYAIDSGGQDSLGGGSNYQAYRIVSSLGCSSSKLCAETISGIMFKSSDVIYLIDRSLSTSPIGNMVKYYTDTYPYTSCASDPDGQRTIFASSASGAPQLVYDHKYSAWLSITGRQMHEVGFLNGSLHYAMDARYFAEEGSVYNDVDLSGLIAANNYSSRMTTGWINPSQIGGFSRVFRFIIGGYTNAAHTLRVRIAYDHDPAFVDNFTFDTTSLAQFGYGEYFNAASAVPGFNAFNIKVYPSRQRCTAIRLEISGEPIGSNYNKALSLAFVTLEAGRKTAVARVGNNRQV